MDKHTVSFLKHVSKVMFEYLRTKLSKSNFNEGDRHMVEKFLKDCERDFDKWFKEH